MGGNLNIRIEELRGMKIEGEGGRRCSKTIGNKGKNFVEWIRDKGLYIVNGSISGVWEDCEYTYIGARGSSVIA